MNIRHYIDLVESSITEGRDHTYWRAQAKTAYEEGDMDSAYDCLKAAWEKVIVGRDDIPEKALANREKAKRAWEAIPSDDESAYDWLKSAYNLVVGSQDYDDYDNYDDDDDDNRP